MKKLLQTVLALLFAVTTSTATAASQDNVGAEVYKKHCVVCHGEKGDGNTRAVTGMNPKPVDFTLPKSASELTRDRMIEGVAEGKPGTTMVAWKESLSAKEIEAVVDYIRESFMRPSAGADTPGKTIFTQNCAVCHGEEGNGKSRASGGLMKKPRDFTSETVRKELTREQMIFSATYGVPNSPMVGFKGRLTEKEIETVVDYIRHTFMKTDESAGKKVKLDKEGVIMGADMSLPFPDGLTGDPVKGGKFYKDTCYMCHGWFGDGKGPRSKFISPPPRDFAHPASRRKYNRPALFAAISKGKLGSEMPAWDKVLTDQQIADVAEYVFQTFIQPQ